MLTDFGKMCRKIRIDADEFLADMAEKLGVASSFLSAVENGKKNVPEGWCDKIKFMYHLSNREYDGLVKAAENSKQQVKIQMAELSGPDRNLVLSFARTFEKLDDQDKDALMQIFKRAEA